MAGIIVVVILLSRFRIVMGYLTLVERRGRGSLLMGVMSVRTTGEYRERILWVNDAMVSKLIRPRQNLSSSLRESAGVKADAG